MSSNVWTSALNVFYISCLSWPSLSNEVRLTVALLYSLYVLAAAVVGAAIFVEACSDDPPLLLP